MKVVTIVWDCSQFIKCAPVSRKLRKKQKSNTDSIVDCIQKPAKTGDWIPVFGDGNGAERIVEILDIYSHS